LICIKSPLALFCHGKQGDENSLAAILPVTVLLSPLQLVVVGSMATSELCA
jgi:hypothetical protein